MIHNKVCVLIFLRFNNIDLSRRRVFFLMSAYGGCLIRNYRFLSLSRVFRLCLSVSHKTQLNI